MNTTTKTLSALAGLALAAGSAHAAPISIDFYGAGTSSGIESGEPDSNNNGLQLDGQIGDWATTPASGTGNFEKSVTIGSIKFTYNPGGAEEISAWQDGGLAGDVRGDFYFINGASPGRYSGAVTWKIEGLTANGYYDLILYSKNSSTGSLYAIGGFDAGNGVGAAVTNDADGDGNFVGVQADGDGNIIGTHDWNGLAEANFAGIQFDVSSVPEPGSLALMGLGGLLIARRRRD